jgi:hypothetical protein
MAPPVGRGASSSSVPSPLPAPRHDIISRARAHSRRLEDEEDDGCDDDGDASRSTHSWRLGTAVLQDSLRGLPAQRSHCSGKIPAAVAAAERRPSDGFSVGRHTRGAGGGLEAAGAGRTLLSPGAFGMPLPPPRTAAAAVAASPTYVNSSSRQHSGVGLKPPTLPRPGLTREAVSYVRTALQQRQEEQLASHWAALGRQ